MSKKAERLYRIIKLYWEIGVGLVVATAFFSFSIEKIMLKLQTEPLEGGLSIGVLVVTIGWLLAYMHASLYELEMLHDQLNIPTAERVSWYALAITVIIAISFGTLVAFCTDVLRYSFIAIVLQMVDCIGCAIVQQAVFLATRTPQQTTLKQATRVIFEYYLYKPIFLHHIGKLLGFFIALVLSLVALYEKKNHLNQLASLTIILTIFIGETVMFKWRQWRDHQLT